MALQQLSGYQILDGSIKDADVALDAALQISKISFNGNFIPDIDNERSVGSSFNSLKYIHSYTVRLKQFEPSMLMDGDLWYSALDSKFKVRENGSTRWVRNDDDGTASESFIIGLLNTTNDEKTLYLYFNRGTVSDSFISWDHLNKFFSISNNLRVGYYETNPKLSFPGRDSRIENAHTIRIVTSGGNGNIELNASSGIYFKDLRLSSLIPLTEDGVTSLDLDGHASSLVGALNWLYDNSGGGGSGETLERDFEAGESISIGKALCLHSDGKVYLANADLISTGRVVGVSKNSGISGSIITVVSGGFIDGVGSSWILNSPVYLSQTVAGNLTQSISNTLGKVITFLGFAISPTNLWLSVKEPLLI